MRVNDRVRLISFLVVGVAGALSVVALIGWNYLGGGRDSSSRCGPRDGGLEYVCLDGAVPEDSEARGCKAYAGSYNVVSWRCARRDP